ncbi:hypothetical protein HPB52_003119 [Rhipicephalus sanguineus]|uniref:Uncharacterized protein n=1 Tax=Rhipicephalus sanguineus TaxID=34632 RepID=A0A9D4PQZ3_RHISA|nr:hypothetical protein HPB52_003119 [Rhipicephalus sanguineus]
MWGLDVIGIKEPTEEKDTAPPEIEAFEESIILLDGRYQVPLMLKHAGIPSGSDNRSLAERHLQAQINRFKGQPELLKQYDTAARTYLNEQHAERVEKNYRPAVTWRMTRVPIGASSSPISLASIIRHHLAGFRERYPETVALLEKDLDVDDLIVGLPNVDKAVIVYSEARKIFPEASMELRKWTSNSHALKKGFLREKVAFEDEAGENTRIKVLGVPWERNGTRLILTGREASDVAANKPSTKRIVLQASASV